MILKSSKPLEVKLGERKWGNFPVCMQLISVECAKKKAEQLSTYSTHSLVLMLYAILTFNNFIFELSMCKLLAYAGT